MYLPESVRELFDAPSCLIKNIMLCCSIMAFLALTSCVARSIGLPVVSVSLGTGLSLFLGVTPTGHVLNLLLTLLLVELMTACYVVYLFRSAKRQLSKEATPPTQAVNANLDSLFCVKDVTLLGLPIAVLVYQVVHHWQPE